MNDLQQFDVSRETMEKLFFLEGLVQKWTRKINLISRHTVKDIWTRHIVDSVQIFDQAPEFDRWIDLGSGGGFPGIVVSVLSAEALPKSTVTLIESDQRKAVFLRTAVRELSLNTDVICERIELAPPQMGDIVSARALADIPTLLSYANRHLAANGTALLMKGEKWEKECAKARKTWAFNCDPIISTTNPKAAILKIKDIVRV